MKGKQRMLEMIDYAIKTAWIKGVKEDYLNNFLWKEDSLKNAFYYHIRSMLGDSFMKENGIRIITEYLLSNGERADIAIIQLEEDKKYMNRDICYEDNVEKVLAIIELKYKNAECNIEPFYSDINKIKRCAKRKCFEETQFYLGFIHETSYSLEEVAWIDRKKEKWLNGNVTELSGFYLDTEEKFVATITSYNNLNEKLEGIYG
jgi:hypothetical protein